MAPHLYYLVLSEWPSAQPQQLSSWSSFRPGRWLGAGWLVVAWRPQLLFLWPSQAGGGAAAALSLAGDGDLVEGLASKSSCWVRALIPRGLKSCLQNRSLWTFLWPLIFFQAFLASRRRKHFEKRTEPEELPLWTAIFHGLNFRAKQRCRTVDVLQFSW